MELELDFIRSLVKMMSEHNLQELALENGDQKIHLLREGATSPAPVQAMLPAMMPQMGVPMPAAAAPAVVAGAEAAAPVGPGPDIQVVVSPMVGTFYRAPSPDSDPFAETGDTVDGDTTIAIIEAMKVMNEIKAEVSGEIVDILVVNGEAVEYGQPLFHIRKAD